MSLQFIIMMINVLVYLVKKFVLSDTYMYVNGIIKVRIN